MITTNLTDEFETKVNCLARHFMTPTKFDRWKLTHDEVTGTGTGATSNFAKRSTLPRGYETNR